MDYSELTYLDHGEITVSRFGKYPTENPTGYAVGFTVDIPNTGGSFYIDTRVTFDEVKGMSTEGISKEALGKLVKTINNRIKSEVEEHKEIIGKKLNPKENQ